MILILDFPDCGGSAPTLTYAPRVWDDSAMTLLTLIALALFAQPGRALPPPAPCSGLPCTAPMANIAEEFGAGGAPTPATLPLVASGECYHLAPWYNGETTHYGYLFLDQKDGNVFMSGSFGFFYPENPYGQISVDEARTRAPGMYDAGKELELGADYAFVDWNKQDPTQPWRYWVKQSGSRLLLVSDWGNRQRVFCRLEKNL